VVAGTTPDGPAARPAHRLQRWHHGNKRTRTFLNSMGDPSDSRQI
jgi:hypothetical protein